MLPRRVVHYLLALLGWLASARAEPADQSKPPQSAAIYDSNPNHLWNRLFSVFYRQKITFLRTIDLLPEGDPNQFWAPRWIGPDVLDPPIGYHPKFLLEDEPFAKCNALLDKFLSQDGATLIHDPLKRALLQRDLWAVFDVLAQAAQYPSISRGIPDAPNPRPISDAQERHRTILERKLAQVIHSLALSHEEIESLPDTYSAAIKSGAFPDVLETNRYNFLPHDLFAADSGWHEVLPGYSSTLNMLPILQHTLIAGGRSVFRAFVKIPAGSQDANTLAEVVENFHQKPAKAPKSLPLGTQFLLLREMICLDEKLQMVPTHVVESVQFRTHSHTDGVGLEVVTGREAELSRVLLFHGQQGGLRSIPAGEPRASFYNSLGHLRVDENGNGPFQPRFPGNCVQCHSSYPNLLASQAAAFSTPARSVSLEPIARWKEASGKLDLLRKLMLTNASDR